MKKYIPIISALFLFGCADIPFSDIPFSDIIAKTEAGVASAMFAINEARTPCVDGDETNNDMCLIDTENFNKAVISAESFDKAVTQAKRLDAVGLPEDAGEWLNAAQTSAATIQSIFLDIKGAN